MGFSNEDAYAMLWPNEDEISISQLVKSGNCSLITAIFQYISHEEKNSFFSIVDPQHYINDLCLVFSYSTERQRDFLITVISLLDENDGHDITLSSKTSTVIDVFANSRSDQLFKVIAQMKNVKEKILTIIFIARHFDFAHREIAHAIVSRIDIEDFKVAIDEISTHYRNDLIQILGFFSHEQQELIKDIVEDKIHERTYLCS